MNAFFRMFIGSLVGSLCLWATLPCMAFTPDEWLRPYPSTGLAWENSRLGISEKVPQPWVPVRHEGRTLSCWGRQFVFSDGLLFDQVTSQGKKLFVGQPRLAIAISGKEVSDRGANWEIMEKSDIGITIQAEIPVAQVAIMTMRARLEYDGFIRFDLKFSPLKEFSLERLRLEIPMAAAHAKMYSKYLSYDFVEERLRGDNLKASVGYLEGSTAFPFSPTFWIGDHDVGLEWVCDTNVNWRPKAVNSAHDVLSEEGVYRFTANMVETGLTVSKDTVYSFGFYATPVKPALSNWRRYLFASNLAQLNRVEQIQKHEPCIIVFPWPERECPLKVHGLPAPYDSGPYREKYNTYRNELTRRNVKYLPYTKLYMLSENPEIPMRYWEQWKSGVGKKWGKSNFMAGTQDIQITMFQKSIQDFYLYQICQAIEKYKINGIYIDVSTPRTNLAGAIYGLDRSTIEAGGKYYVPLFAHREYMKRLYSATQALNKDFLVIPHSGKITQVFGAFAHFVISGESLNRIFIEMGGITKVRTNQVGRDNVVYSDQERYVPDYFSISPEIFPEIDYLQTFGYKNIILPQIEKRNVEALRKHPQKEIEWSRSLLANALVYDLPVWVKRIHMATYFDILNLVDRFITLDDTVKHIPAYQAESAFGVPKTEHLAMTGYRKDNKAMVVILNRSETPQDLTITLPSSWLGSGGDIKTAVDAESNIPLKLQGKQVRLPVRGKDFMIAFFTF